jgi:predicted nucleic acid-binding protein
MSSSTFIDLRINNAEQFKESVSEPTPNSKIYLVYGKTDAWANDASPNISNSSVSTMYQLWDNMIGGKRILGGDMYHVITRHNWTSNTIYTAYDHMNSTLFDSNVKFYAMNSNYSVYKCIANNNGQPSTTEPTSVNPEIITETNDGYKWKYMYTINDAEKLRFVTDAYIPVKTLTVDDGSLQWKVQSNAIFGSIDSIVLTNTGNNYTNASNVSIVIAGDGSLATAQATVNTTSNTISSIIITERGSGYTYATVSISDLGTGINATARAIISPFGGHGSNPLYELGGKNILINSRLRYDEETVLPATNDYRQIALLKDPYLYQSTNVASNIAALQATTATCDGVGNYVEDEFVYQGTSLTNSTFSGRVVSWNSTTSKLLLINTKGTHTLSQAILGSTSFTTRILTNYQNGTFEKYSGRLLYVDNIEPITRSSDQIENFQILLKF